MINFTESRSRQVAREFRSHERKKAISDKRYNGWKRSDRVSTDFNYPRLF